MWRRRAPRARRTPISPRRSSTEMTITLVMPTPPTTRATAPSAEQQVAQRDVGRGPGGQRVRRPRHVDLVRRFRVDAAGQHRPHRLDLVGHRAHVQRRRRRRRGEQLVGDGVADQRRRSRARAPAAPARGCRSRRTTGRRATPATPASASSMPSRRAASAPSTTVGSRVEAASRKRPSASSAPTTSSSDGSAAATRMPPVTASSTRSVATDGGVDGVMPAASVTGPIAGRRVAGRLGQRRRLAERGLARRHPQQVGAEARRARRCRSARLDAEMPTTATIAAMPMAIPSAVSIVRRPPGAQPDRARRGTGRATAATGCATVDATPVTRATRRRSTIRPSRSATRRGARAAMASRRG